jgi:hypothetical protein
LPAFRVSPKCPADKAAAEARFAGYGAVEHRDVSSRDGGPPVNGRLPPEEIQRLVRAHYAVFRACYEAGLGRNKTLEGIVQTKFVIDPSGSVSDVALDCTTMPDEVAVTCIVNGYRDLKFQQPEGGIVTVVYPIEFSPD